MGSTAQLYNLGWREFGVSLKSAVQGLRSKGDLMDVTLAAGGKTFPAHKLVLSAASPLLLELLKVTPCQHPVILLAGIGASDLESLLEFVYSGEVSVHPSQLPSLLQAAHVLNIHGLVQGTITAEKPENQSVADAAMKASTAANQKMSITSLAAATSAGLAAAVGNAGDGVRRRRRAKRKTSDCSDGPNDKWGRCDSGAESSDAETHSKDLRCTITAQTVQSQASISQIHVGQQNNIQMGSSNSISAPEPGAKPSKQSIGTLTSLSIVPGTLKSGLVKSESGLVVGSQSSNQNITQGSSDNPGSVNHDGSMVPPHHLDLTSADDDDNNTHSGDDTLNLLLGKASLGGSNQPGICPLCGTALRQARNLRRHLLTSCKYRFSQPQHVGDVRGVNSSDVHPLHTLRSSGPADQNCCNPSIVLASSSLDSSTSVPTNHEQSEIVTPHFLSMEPEEIVCKPSIVPSPLSIIMSPEPDVLSQ